MTLVERRAQFPKYLALEKILWLLTGIALGIFAARGFIYLRDERSRLRASRRLEHLRRQHDLVAVRPEYLQEARRFQDAHFEALRTSGCAPHGSLLAPSILHFVALAEELIPEQPHRSDVDEMQANTAESIRLYVYDHILDLYHRHLLS